MRNPWFLVWINFYTCKHFHKKNVNKNRLNILSFKTKKCSFFEQRTLISFY